MGNLKGYTGGAGTGKTTMLIGELTALIQTVKWDKYNSILALTFMHGSRRRLQEKLSFLHKEKVLYKCQTIDSFATHIVERFRRFIGISKNITVIPGEDQTKTIENEKNIFVGWDFIRKAFVQLLALKVVRDFISVSYPIIIIDEFQDCKDQLLKVIIALTKSSVTVLIAGDEFQQLNETENCPAIEWLQKNAIMLPLTTIYRTQDTSILASAKGLRTNQPIVNSILVELVPSPSLAAWNIGKLIQWKQWGSKGANVVLLYPTSPEKSIFISEVLKRLHQPFENSHLRAHPFKPENVADTELILENLDLEENSNGCINMTSFFRLITSQVPMVKMVAQKAIRLLRLQGLEEMTKVEFEQMFNREIFLHKSFFSSQSIKNKTAMTIHAAKNREFEDVIILWPYQVTKDIIYKRKLLYNAITRAKRNAILIVQAKNEAAFKKDPVLSLFDKVNSQPSPKKNK
jgi:superfamily I DNA/RNA helicase